MNKYWITRAKYVENLFWEYFLKAFSAIFLRSYNFFTRWQIALLPWKKVKFLKFRKWLKIYNRAISISVNDAGLSYRSIFYTPLFAVDVISHKSYSNRYYILNIYLNLVAQFTNSADFESFCIWSRIKICSWYGNC